MPETDRKSSGRARMESRGVVPLTVNVPEELKEIVGRFADEEGLSVNQFVARVLARQVKRPDLAKVPRRRPGRPSKKVSAA